jgi:hypothetical protein
MKKLIILLIAFMFLLSCELDERISHQVQYERETGDYTVYTFYESINDNIKFWVNDYNIQESEIDSVIISQKQEAIEIANKYRLAQSK